MNLNTKTKAMKERGARILARPAFVVLSMEGLIMKGLIMEGLI